MTESRCPWKVHWGVGQESTTQCEKPERHDWKSLATRVHEGRVANPAAEAGFTVITWLGGDRREYTGEWPGPCDRTAGCILHLGHHGGCAT